MIMDSFFELVVHCKILKKKFYTQVFQITSKIFFYFKIIVLLGDKWSR